MIVSITAQAKVNARPTSIGLNSKTIGYGEEIIFSVADFTTETIPQYSDPEGDDLSFIKVITVSSTGELILNGNNVNIGDLITAGEISTGNFKYVSNSLEEGEYNDSFKFDVADMGSQSLSGLSGGQMNVVVKAKVNLPPDEVGDNAINSAYGDSVIFSGADFTTNTTPAYNDPEGDPAYAVKILTLPISGTLELDGVPVVINQEILISEIEAGYLLFNPDGH